MFLFKIIDNNAEIKHKLSGVSSVLNRDVKQFGKKYLFDGEEETCWNSDEGSAQWIHLKFPRLCCVQKLKVKFQGGFAGKQCHIETRVDESSQFVKLTEFYPEDINSLQEFPVEECPSISEIKVVFNSSTDFFGRITIYTLNILGEFV